jgi:predicted O-methyltransferase YrrM
MISDQLQQLLLKYTEPEDVLLQQIDRQTNLKVLLPRMISGHYQGRVLSFLSKMISPKRILEIGTFTGYATLCLAEGLSNEGIIYTLDINVELEDMVRENFAKSALNSKIKYIIGDANEKVAALIQDSQIQYLNTPLSAKYQSKIAFDLYQEEKFEDTAYCSPIYLKGANGVLL